MNGCGTGQGYLDDEIKICSAARPLVKILTRCGGNRIIRLKDEAGVCR